ncbi:hypothetical protein ACIF80_13350 [Streptomyces sp. NPDC085927]
MFPKICDWHEKRGFVRERLSAPDAGFGVGMHRLASDLPPSP